MKKLIYFLLFLSAMTLFSEDNLVKNSELKQSGELKNIISYIEKTYKNINVLDADFKQTFLHKAYKRKKHSSGHVIFTKDLKMKWSYKTPEEKYIISNAKTLWIYEPENEQAF
jgi:chaperone LolA